MKLRWLASDLDHWRRHGGKPVLVLTGARQVGKTTLNASELARDAGIATETAHRYLRYLELSFQVVLLKPFFSNRSKRLIKSPRLHWTDVGIWRAVTRRWEGLPGSLYESAVVAECLKVLEAFRLDWEPFHLRTYDRREIDLLLVRNDATIAIEIKSGERVSKRDARHLRDVEEVTGLRNELSLVIYRGREIVPLDVAVHAQWPSSFHHGWQPAPSTDRLCGGARSRQGYPSALHSSQTRRCAALTAPARRQCRRRRGGRKKGEALPKGMERDALSSAVGLGTQHSTARPGPFPTSSSSAARDAPCRPWPEARCRT